MACPAQKRQTQSRRSGNSVPNERRARYSDVIGRRPSVMERIDTDTDRDYLLNFMDTIPITRNTPLKTLKHVPTGTIYQVFDYPAEDKQSFAPENSRPNQTCPPRIELENMGPAERLVKDTIASHKVVIFSTTTCPYCKMAKELFQKLNQKFTSIELNQRHDADELLDVLGQITGGGRTVPRIFVNGKFIGTNVKQMYENGSLKAVLANSPRIELENMGPAAKFVKNTIASDKVVIFSTTTCPYCKMAKEIFQKLNQKFTAIELNQRDDADELLDVLGEITGGGRTVPRIFVNGKFIGKNVRQMYENGSLKALLANSPRIELKNMGLAEKFVKNAIASDKVVIFSTTTCPYCKMAKEQFQKLNQKFTAIELNQRDDKDELLDVLGEITGGGRTVPRVFVNGKFIGGGTDVKEMYENGSLRALLANSPRIELENMGPAEKFVKNTIASDKVVIFSTTTCPYCKMAKEIFQKLNQKFTSIELNQRDDADELLDVLGEITGGGRTVPRIFVNGKFIGKNVRQMYENGSLKALLANSPRIELENMGPAEKFVKNAIASDKVVIFSKTTCPYCKMAKEQFQKLNQKFKTIELNQRDDADELLDVLGEITGGRTVPRVFVNGKFIGGGTDVKEMYENGSLRASLANSPRIELENMGPAEKFVKNTIASDKVVIFSTTTCPYCKMAKEQFKKLNQEFTTIELDQRDDADELLDVLGEITGGGRTVPRIFVNGKFIGTNVKQMYENGSLRALLANSPRIKLENMGPAEKFVKNTIASDKVVIFSTTTCLYCKMAKELFQKLNQKFTSIELNQRDDADELLDVLGEITGGGRTVPRIFVNGKFIGTNVKQMYENGCLRALLAK